MPLKQEANYNGYEDTCCEVEKTTKENSLSRQLIETKQQNPVRTRTSDPLLEPQPRTTLS